MSIIIALIGLVCGLLLGSLIKSYYFDHWQVVWSERAVWEIEDASGAEYTKHATYTIYWSEKTDKFKLETSGHNPTSHRFYSVAVEKLNSLRQSATKSYN
jgi:hypothetical protein